MPSRNITIEPYEVPGGTANTEVAISFELVDADGAPQLGYDEILGDGVAGAYATIVRDTAVTVALQTTEGLVPTLYWRFKAQWGSLTGYKSYTSGLISLAEAGGDLTLVEFLALEAIPGTTVGLTADEVAAIHAAASPSASNPFATADDVAATAWGDITGTLSSQTDLQSALDAKASASTLTTHIADTNAHGISTFGATLVDDANAATARATLGLAALATHATVQGSPSGETDPNLFASTQDGGAIEMVTAAGARSRLGLATVATSGSLVDLSGYMRLATPIRVANASSTSQVISSSSNTWYKMTMFDDVLSSGGGGWLTWDGTNQRAVANADICIDVSLTSLWSSSVSGQSYAAVRIDESATGDVLLWGPGPSGVNHRGAGTQVLCLSSGQTVSVWLFTGPAATFTSSGTALDMKLVIAPRAIGTAP